MSGLFGRRNPAKQAQLEQARQAIAGRFAEMVIAALEQLTTCAFPGSRVEPAGTGRWQLVHAPARGRRRVDVTVTLEFKKKRPLALTAEHTRDGLGRSISVLTFDRVSLDDALRRCLSGL
jgi:hypothetical protein